ncbi:MAG: hypothetical protein PHO30_02785, partial [Candidatus Omnitrophica bacterium]|nr:hypothetical protein [Candidatus Omnitrophota bacterium]
STAETTFLFFLFTGLLFFIRHERGGSFRDLIVAALFIGLSSLCRFEGGIVIGLLSALLLREPKKLFVFGGIAACLPVVWVAGNYVLFGNPFYFLTASDAVVRWEFNKLNAYGIDHTFWRKVPYWPLQCKDYFGWPVFVMGIYGVGRWALKKKNRMFSVVFIGLLCVFMVKTTRERLAMESRYGMSLGFLFLGFFSRAFVGIARAIKPSHAKIMLMVFFLLVTVRGTYIGLTKLPRIPQRLRQTAEFLRRNITLCGNEAIYVDCDEDNFKEPIKLFSGIDVDRFVDFESTASHIELLQPADRERIKYIVLVSWTRTLPRYKEIFRTDECRIYQIRK